MRDPNKRHHDPKKPPPPPSGDEKCKENDTLTQKLINTERKLYCKELDTAAGSVFQWEENYAGWKVIKQKKKCLFVWTEKNYEVFRNLQIKTGTSLLQFNESIKDATGSFLKANKSLADGLKDVLKKVKDVKDKIYLLKKQACDLKDCVHNTCNCTQWGVLTGEWSKDCKGKREDPPRPPECDNILEKFDKLFCIPKALVKDVDYLFKAAADVVGIQVFSNIGTLENLQKSLSESAKAFDKHLTDTVKKDQDELKKMQEDLVKAIQEFSKSKATLYWKRSEFEGLFETATFFCCPICGCVHKNNDCEPRLEKCKKDICDICDEVKDTFCSDTGTTTTTTQTQTTSY